MNCVECDLELEDLSTRCPRCGTEVQPEPTQARAKTQPDAEIIDGKWVVERRLGQGGMGTVYLAHDVDLGRLVAVKCMAAMYADNADLVARFEREARMMARLDHPNLVPVYAVGRRDNAPFIVMKYLEGSNLGDYLAERTRLSAAELLPIVKQLCEGLQFVHDHNVVHRDLKPANVFVSPRGHVTLLDLGVARDTANNMTRTGVIVGTPRYMSPEQILGKRVDKAADIYALASVVFELITGRLVFEGDTDYALMRAHVDTEPPSAVELADVPVAIDEVLKKGLAKEPTDRFESAREFYAALEAAFATGTGTMLTPPPRAPKKVIGNRATPMPRVLKSPRQPTPAPKREVVEPAEVEAPLPNIGPSKTPLFVVLGLVVIAVVVGLAVFKPWASPEPVAVKTPPPPPVEKKVVVEQLIEKPVETPTPPPADVVAPPAPEPVVKKTVPRSAEVTFIYKVNGSPVSAFVDVDGMRLKATPFRQSLSAGEHTVVFHPAKGPSVTRTVTVVGGEPKKIIVEAK